MDHEEILENASVIATGFNDTAYGTFDYLCPNGTCIEEHAMMIDQQVNATARVSEAMADDQLKDLLHIALDDIEETFNFNTTDHHEVLDAETPEEAAMMIEE